MCNSIRTTDEVSFRLLELVPLLSAAGILGISLSEEIASSPLLQGIAFFAATITAALFTWEWRNLNSCKFDLHYAIVLKKNIFYTALGNLGEKVPDEQQKIAMGQFTHRPDNRVRLQRAAETVIYSVTILAWILIGIMALSPKW